MIIDNSRELFSALNFNKDKILSNKQKKFLLDEGYLILKNQIEKKLLRRLNIISTKLIKKEKIKGGWEGKEEYFKKGKEFDPGTNRLGNLIDKDKAFKELIKIPQILVAADIVIKSKFKVCGLNLRNPKKGKGKQVIHTDWKPKKHKKERFAGIVCMIYLDDSNKKNGATRIIPKSHHKIGWPDQFINIKKKYKKEIRPELKAGSILIINLNLWHAGAENISGKTRKMIMLNIKNRNLPQLLNYKKYLSIKTKKKLNSVEKYLLAVRKKDKTQKSKSIGVGVYYKKDFNIVDKNEIIYNKKK
jgi:hypothetical protein